MNNVVRFGWINRAIVEMFIGLRGSLLADEERTHGEGCVWCLMGQT